MGACLNGTQIMPVVLICVPLWGEKKGICALLSVLFCFFAFFGGVVGGFGFGALTHVLLDMCTTHGVPLLPFAKKRFSLKLCSTGSIGEYALLIMCILVFWIMEKPELIRFDVPLY